MVFNVHIIDSTVSALWWGLLAVSLNCNPLSYLRGCTLPSFAPLKSRSDNTVISTYNTPYEGYSYTVFFQDSDMVFVWVCIHVFAYNFCVFAYV